MKKLVPILAFVAALAAIGQLGRLTFRYAYAQAIADAPYDAGVPAPAAPTVTVTAPATSDIAITAPSSEPQTSAPADTDSLPATPVAVDSSFWSRVEALWRAGSLAPALLLAAFGLIVIARRHVAWLQKGQAAAYSAMVVTALTTLLEPAIRGATPSLAMIISSVTGAVLLSTKTSPPAVTASGELPGGAP